MGRAGSRVLEEAGLALGEVKTESRHNPKGNRESELLQKLHDAVLADNGGSWRKPPKKTNWSEERRAALASYIAGMDAAHDVWGSRIHARCCSSTSGVASNPIDRVGDFRHPLAVFRSLASRNNDFKEKEAVKLWAAYNERLLGEHEREPFTVMRFDVEPPTLHAQLEVVAKELGLDVPPGEFFDEGFVHNTTEEEVPRHARDVWNALLEIALRSIHFATVHFQSERWIDPQLRAIANHTSTDYRSGPASTASTDRSRRGSIAPSTSKANTGTNSTSSHASLEEAARDDLIVFIDGDAFPIAEWVTPVRAGSGTSRSSPRNGARTSATRSRIPASR